MFFSEAAKIEAIWAAYHSGDSQCESAFCGRE